MRIRLGWAVCLALAAGEANAHEGAPLTLSRLGHDTTPAVLYARAESYRNLSKIEDALVALELVEALHPEQTRVWLERGRLELDRGEHRAAIEAIDEYLRRGGPKVYGARLMVARARAALGEDPIADYRAAVEAAPGIDAFYEAGRHLIASGRRDRAAAWLRRGVEATSADVLVELLVRVDPARAEPLITERLRRARVKTRWLLLRAEARTNPQDAAADRRAAVAEAERLVSRRPTPLALTERALAYLAIDRKTAAIDDLRRAVRRAPNYMRAQKLLEEVTR